MKKDDQIPEKYVQNPEKCDQIKPTRVQINAAAARLSKI